MSLTATPHPTAAPARAEAGAAATRAAVTVRPLDPEGAWQAGALLTSLWGVSVIEPPLMIALAHSGAYVAGAYDGDDRLVGVCVGHYAQPLGTALHSHVAAVARGHGRRGIGLALKLDQRAWCLERGLTRLTWTYDPLVSRNATFNVAALGAAIEEYLVDAYGPMTDAVNAGQGSDRLLAAWDLNRPWPPPAAAAGAVANDPRIEVEVPADIERLRQTDPASAAAWRARVRAELSPRIGHGWTVTGFHDHRYRLEGPA